MAVSLQNEVSKAATAADSSLLYSDLGFLYKMFGVYETALSYTDSALELSLQIDFEFGQARAHANKASIKYDTGDLVGAMIHARKNLTYCLEVDSVSAGDAYYLLGMIQLEYGFLSSAFDTLNLAIDVFEVEERKGIIGGAYGLTSFIQSKLGNEAEGINLQEKAVAILKEVPSSRAYVQALCALADKYRLANDFDSAFETLKVAQDYADEHHFEVERLTVTQRYGELFLDQGKYHSSIDSLTLFLEEILASKSYKELNRNQYFLSKAYQELGDVKKGISSLELALMHNISAGRGEDEERVFKQLSQLYSREGRFQEAYENHLIYEYLQKEHRSEEQLKLTRELNAKYKSEVQKVELLEKDQLLAKQETEITKSNSRNQLFGFGLIAILGLSIGSYIWFRQRIKTQRQAAQLELNQALVESTENERERIARELHDGTGSLLTGLKLSLDRLYEQDISDAQKSQVGQSIEQVQVISKEVRRVSHAMAPAAIDRLKFTDVLSDLIQTFTQIGKSTIDYSTSGDLERMSKTERLMLYRILQECLNNSFKHSEATEINVSVSADDDEVEMLFQDNGKGYDKKRVDKGIGLGSIEKRIQYLKGKRILETEKGQGVLLIINFPIA